MKTVEELKKIVNKNVGLSFHEVVKNLLEDPEFKDLDGDEKITICMLLLAGVRTK